MKLVIDALWDGQEAEETERVSVHLRDEGSGLRVRINAPWHRDPPPPGPLGPTDKLWEYEVVELFIAGAGEPTPYTEFEVGPYGHYLLLTLSDVRQTDQTLLPAEVTVTRDRRGFEARIRIDAAHLPPRPWRVNACAIHGVGAERRYLSSVTLPGDAPDFHQPGQFILLKEAF